jgi:hypothetical protein
MVEGVSERVDTPTDRMRLRVGCSTVVIFCCRFGGDHANAAPVLSRRLTRRLMERTGEVGLARKLEGQRNMGQRLVPLPEQLFGELKPLRADIVMRRSADRGACTDIVASSRGTPRLPALHFRLNTLPMVNRPRRTRYGMPPDADPKKGSTVIFPANRPARSVENAITIS